MHALIAQVASDSIWPAAINAINNNGLWIFVGFCVLAGTAKHLVGRVLQHHERIAKIKAGVNHHDETQIYPRQAG